MQKKALLLVLVLIILTAVMRFFPLGWNINPIGAIALLGGFFFKDIKKAILIPLACLFAGDLLLHINFLTGGSEWPGFYPGIAATYIGFALMTLVGRNLIKSPKWLNIWSATLVGAVVFFLASNFGVWMTGQMYPLTASGLLASYAAGIPFFKASLLGDLVYTTALFGAFKVAAAYWQFKPQSQRAYA